MASCSVLARWGSWGAVPELFDEHREEWVSAREELRGLLDDDAYAAARRTTINAHYTDPAIAREIWRLVQDLGFSAGRVLEPGCGAGVFISLAPEGAQMTGVELDPTSAAIAAALNPACGHSCGIVCCHAAARRLLRRDDRERPVCRCSPARPAHNSGRHSMHNHFIVKSLALTAPAAWSRCSRAATRLTLATRPRAARSLRSPICSARCACRPARTAAPPAPTPSPTC